MEMVNIKINNVDVQAPAQVINVSTSTVSREITRNSNVKGVYDPRQAELKTCRRKSRKLLEVLQKLTDAGNTVLVIEHNLDVIKSADYLIDLGPEGGSGGGTIVATGTPEEVAQNPNSFTGQYLKPVLERAAELQQSQK